MATISTSFTAVGVGAQLLVKHGDSFSYSVSGTFVGTVIIESSQNPLSFFNSTGVSATAAASGTIVVNAPDQGYVYYRFRCSAFTSGTIVTSLADVAKVLVSRDDGSGLLLQELKEDGFSRIRRPSQVLSISAAGQAKAGTTAGFVVAVGDNKALVTCPANSTASTLVVPIPRLKVGDIITSFYLDGQIESAGGTVTVDADLRVMTAAAADVTDASVGSITQLSVIADTVMSSANTAKSSLSQTVAAGESYYVLITATTGAATDIALQNVAVVITEN